MRNLRISEDYGDRSEYQESVDGDEEDTVRDEMRILPQAECALYIRRVGKGCKRALFPFRAFERPCSLQEHHGQYSAEEYNWRASGKQQLRARCALYGEDNMSPNVDAVFPPSPNCIRRPAAIIRAKILRGAPDVESRFPTSILTGEDIRLDQYTDGAAFRNLNYARGAPGRYTRRGFGYPTAEWVYNEPQ